MSRRIAWPPVFAAGFFGLVAVGAPASAGAQTRPMPPTRPGVRCAASSEERWLDAKDPAKDRSAFVCGDNYYVHLDGTGTQPPKNRCDLTLYRTDDDLPVVALKLVPGADGKAMAWHRLHGRHVLVELMDEVDVTGNRCHVRVSVR